MILSVVIPAYNEEGSISETVTTLYHLLQKEQIVHEILVVNDNSKDRTLQILEELKTKIPTLTVYTNPGPNGFGFAVRYGLENFTGDCVAIMMADLSDDPADLVKFYFTMRAHNYDCVFGNRWIKGGKVYDYPQPKRFLNRMVNNLISWSLALRYNDLTNAFKLYKKETIQGLKPFLSPHFNLTLELSLKAIVRNYTFVALPNSWRNRKTGESKLKIREMGSRYFFIYLYCLIEKFFARGDFKKKW
ncbi:MAG TPA: glycosyltransferase family 2 protein [Niastella sp.]